ncbi:MAG: hypothetical protein U0X91_29580 [Spirosomataceae bacterium]
MSIPKLYRQPKLMLLLLLLLFAALAGLCWYGYHLQLHRLEEQLQQIERQAGNLLILTQK